MSTHSEVIFTFTGLDADHNRLDASDLATHVAAGRQLLALHAHYYAWGNVLARIPSRGRGYRVYALAPIASSVRIKFAIEIDVDVTEVAVGLGRNVAYPFVRLLGDCLRGLLTRKLRLPPPELRREPTLPWYGEEGLLGRGNVEKLEAPTPDEALLLSDLSVKQAGLSVRKAEQEQAWQELHRRTAVILAEACRPIGRSATTLVISGDDLQIAMIDEVDLGRLLEGDGPPGDRDLHNPN